MKKIFSLMLVFVLTVTVYSAKGPILLQGAMDMEVDTFVERLDNVKEESFNGYTFWTGTIEGQEVVVSRTEVGLVNATASTILGIQKYNPSVIINQGTSGGHHPDLHTFDIVVGTSTFNMGAYRSQLTPEGKGINTENWDFIPFPTTVRVDGEKVVHESFYGDKDLIEAAMDTEYKNGKLVEGVIGSADQWNRELDRINQLHTKFGTSVEEMETVAVAQMAEVYDIPFVGVRVLSNTDVHGEEFDPKSAVYCQEFVMDMLKNIK